jgi:hypothetical protein
MSLRIGDISVGAAFRPRLNDYGVRVTQFSWLESHSHEKLVLSLGHHPYAFKS